MANEVKRDRWGRYVLPVPAGPTAGQETSWTRVTTFAKSIADTYGLNQWAKRNVAIGIVTRPELYARAAALASSSTTVPPATGFSTPSRPSSPGPADKEALDAVVREAEEAAGSRSAASLGTALHQFAEQVDRGDSPVVPPPWDEDIAEYRSLVAATGLRFSPSLIERIVIIDQYQSAGMFDRIAELTRPLLVRLPGQEPVILDAGTWVIVDLKTGKDVLTYGMQEIAIQLAMYANADGIWDPGTRSYEPLPPVRRDIALVTHLPVGQRSASLVAVDIARGWEACRLCQEVRQWRGLKTLGAPVQVTQDWSTKINLASTKEEIAALWEEGTRLGEWTEELTMIGKERLRRLEQSDQDR